MTRTNPDLPALELQRAQPSRSVHASLCSCARLAFGFVFVAMLMVAQPSAAAWDWEGSKAEDVTAKVVDAAIVRPIATARVLVGAAMFIPASLFSFPSGKEGIGTAYDVLIVAPMEYAFDRKLGEF